MSDKKNILNAPNQALCPTLFPSLGNNLTKKKPNIITTLPAKNTPTNLNLNSNKNATKNVSTPIHNDAFKDLEQKKDLPKNISKSMPKDLSKDLHKNTKLLDSTFAQNSDGSGSDDESEDSGETVSNVPLITELTLSKKETYHYKIIDKYYKMLNINDITTLIEIVEKKSKVSLRLIDWFVTKYSYKYKVRLETNTDPSSIDNGFNVHISYKAQLQSYKKKYFDPFRRRKRLKFKYFFDKEKKISLCTTIGQLNFFKWAFTNNIVNYVINNYEIISKAMTQSNKLDKSKKQGISNSDTTNTSISDVTSNDNASTGAVISRGKKQPNKLGKKGKKPGIVKPVTKPSGETMSLKF